MIFSLNLRLFIKKWPHCPWQLDQLIRHWDDYPVCKPRVFIIIIIKTSHNWIILCPARSTSVFSQHKQRSSSNIKSWPDILLFVYFKFSILGSVDKVSFSSLSHTSFHFFSLRESCWVPVVLTMCLNTDFFLQQRLYVPTKQSITLEPNILKSITLEPNISME